MTMRRALRTQNYKRKNNIVFNVLKSSLKFFVIV